jgi:hypothetical protein
MAATRPETQHAGRRIKRFKAGDRLTPLSAERINELVDSLNALNNIQFDNPKNNVTYSDGNVMLHVGAATDNGGGGGDGSTKQYRLLSVQSDHITAGEWDGASFGETVIIAKPAKLRNTIGAAKFFRGTSNEIDVTYTYGAGPDDLNVMRVYTDEFGRSEVQMVVPIWLVDDDSSFSGGLNDLIYAQETDHTLVMDTGDVECKKLMCHDRMWARVDDPPPTITANGTDEAFSAVNAAAQVGIQVTSDVPTTQMTFTGTTTVAGYDLGNTSTPQNITLLNLYQIDPNCVQQGGLEVYGNSALIDFSAAKLITCCGTLAIYNNDSLTSINLNSLQTAGDMLFSGAALSSLSLPALVPQDGMPFDASGAPLDQTSVDGILARFVANGSYATGIVNLGGDCSAPSGAGYADAATLVGRGVTVTTN